MARNLKLPKLEDHLVAVSRSHFDVPIDYDNLINIGSMMVPVD